MLVERLGQINIHIPEIEMSDNVSIAGLLEKFLDLYQKDSRLRHQPILLVLSNFEEKIIMENPIYKHCNESEYAYKLRMLDAVANQINRSKNLICGFCAVYVTNNELGARRMGIVFYEPPICSAPLNEKWLPPADQQIPFFTVLGRLVPPSA